MNSRAMSVGSTRPLTFSDSHLLSFTATQNTITTYDIGYADLCPSLYGGSTSRAARFMSAEFTFVPLPYATSVQIVFLDPIGNFNVPLCPPRTLSITQPTKIRVAYLPPYFDNDDEGTQKVLSLRVWNFGGVDETVVFTILSKIQIAQAIQG